MSDNNVSYELQQIQSTLAALTDRLAAATSTQVGGMQMYIAVGWSPIIALTNDGTYYYAQIIDWTGGSGIKPPVMQYLCATGWTYNVAEAARVGVVGGGLPDGDKGDITVASGIWTIDNGVITTIKLADRSVTVAKLFEVGHEKLIGRHGAGAGDAQEIGIDGGLELQGGNIRRSALTGDVTASAGDGVTTIATGAVTTAKMGGDVTTAGKALLDDADAAAQRTTLGLGNVDNTADASKPVSTLQAAADTAVANAAASALAAHVSAADPHTGYQLETEKGVANGYASLDGDGKVPSAQLPSVSGGKIINVWTASTTTAVAGTTAIPLDDTIPQITEGMELIRVSVTPTNPSSNLMVTVRFWYTCSGAHYASCAIFVGAGPNALESSFLTQNASSIPALATVVFIIPSFSGTQDISFRAGTDRISVTFRMLSTGAGSYYSTTDPAIMIVEEIAP